MVAVKTTTLALVLPVDTQQLIFKKINIMI